VFRCPPEAAGKGFRTTFEVNVAGLLLVLHLHVFLPLLHRRRVRVDRAVAGAAA
jgi:hypothetical protein